MRVVLLLLCAWVCLVWGWKVRESVVNNPLPNPQAVVSFGNARFTVLTPQLVRMEYSPSGVFVDQASLVFLNRYLPVPQFLSSSSGNILNINTLFLNITYNKGVNSGNFNPQNLAISFGFNQSTTSWMPGMANPGNLNGTRTSLDCYTTSCQDGMPLEPGLISTDGWNLFDDSATPLFNFSTPIIPWASLSRPANSLDWYFFGYGYDYTQILYDYSLLSGPVAIPPISAFGTWWSRYYNYSESEIIDQVIDGYVNYSLPLNHLVLDMDWHIETKDKQCNTWGGYTWNTALFPNPPAFINYLHSPPLDLHVHPQTGVDDCQAEYQELAKTIGFNTATNALGIIAFIFCLSLVV